MRRLYYIRAERAPYTPQVFREVRHRLAAGERQKDIAADLGWHPARVSEIKTGKRGSSNCQR
jgi:hypothetical protein